MKVYIYIYDTELCTLCDLNINGDEYHYIMICPYFKQRNGYFKHYFYTEANLLNSSEKQTYIVQVGKNLLLLF